MADLVCPGTLSALAGDYLRTSSGTCPHANTWRNSSVRRVPSPFCRRPGRVERVRLSGASIT